ncbi:hypothetical protein Back11_20360 [Paenibacillus baekrokdamisoli]|uniref:Uncharacterized protein n=1 Tax=Paenibacillus baekrokdamisoli TaxID=1712516 RepID=A0A3G9J4H2_9BACL|nr:hypothetical protein [Paenibacillus baekrokdamisoli]MBB3069958.1 hypothetical protein [Paenibacillus baekrokdamisoli]BBH20691.1 hypothetical protein Back11_20360 [Paenibacillus baekrokdamisoli]
MKQLPKHAKSFTLAALAALTLSIQAGTAGAAPTTVKLAPYAVQAVAADSSVSTQIFNKYMTLLNVKGQLPKAITYLNAHIDEVSAYQASLMVLRLENAIVKVQSTFDQSIANTSIQEAINKVYKIDDSFANIISRTKDKKLKTLLQAASDNGLKLETAEGFYFPIVDYKGFQKYRAYVGADVKAYIDIMTVESEQANVKDAGLMIGYQQLANRALSQEQFVKQFPNSNRTAAIKTLYNNYKTLTFYGVNNTPLFDYETNEMQPNAIKGYTMILDRNKDTKSDYLNLLQKFMDLAKDHGYKQTAEVTAFRKANVPIN